MGRGEKSLLCDPGSELRLGRRENRRAKIINETEKKKSTFEFRGGNLLSFFVSFRGVAWQGGGCYSSIGFVFYEKRVFVLIL